MVARGTIVAVVAGVIAAVIVASVYGVLVLRQQPSVKKMAIELWYPTGHYGDTDAGVAQILKTQLEKDGFFTVTLQSSAWSQYTQQFSRGQLPFFMLGWFPDFADSDNYVTPFLSPGGAKSLGSQYNNTTINGLIAQETGGPVGSRAQAFSAVQDQLAKDVPYLPLWQTGANAVYEKDVSGVILDPFLFRYYFIGKAGATEVKMSTSDTVTNLDPALEYDLFSGTVVGNVFDTLYTTTPTDGTTTPSIVPLLADGDATPVGGDTTLWEVKLKHNLQFSNGDPITAEDVKFSFKRLETINDPDSAAFYFTQLMDNKTLDSLITCVPEPCSSSYTIHFKLNQMYSLFPNLLTFSTASILNHNVFSNDLKKKISDVNLPTGAGSGPYMVDTANSDKNTRITMTANTKYNFPNMWASFQDKGAPAGAVPVAQKFTINIRSGSPNLKADIQTRQVNLVYRSLNPQDVKGLQSDNTLNVKIGSSPQIRYLVFNVQKPPFDNVNVRKAIAYLVNRQAIVDTVFQGLAQPLWSLIPPGWDGHKEVFKDVYGSAPDPGKARDLLQNVKQGVQPAEIVIRVAGE